MQIIRRILPILTIALLLFSGCRSRKEQPSNPPADTTRNTPSIVVTPNGNNQVVTPPSYQPHYYTCNFSCSAQGMSASGQMRLQQDSVIWLCATKVIELGRAMFTPDSVIIYAKVMNRCFRGDYNDLATRFHYRTTFKQLYRHVTAEDAEQQLTDLSARFGIEATIKMGPLKEVDQLNFPFVVPRNATQL